MTLSRLVYVRCDLCGNPAGTGDDLSDAAREARLIAKRLGFIRRDGLDLCPACSASTC